MAFFRFSRDKKGYEHYSLVEPTTNRRGKVKPRVLYWFRTPPGILVGREPFDEGVRRALEAQYPTVSFDWPSILDAPIPSADADKWRERRRSERAAKAMARADVDDVVEDGHGEAAGEPPGDDAPSTAAEETAALPASAGAVDPARKRRRRRRGRQPGAPVLGASDAGAPDAGVSDDDGRPPVESPEAPRATDVNASGVVKGSRSGEGTATEPLGD